MTDTAASHHRKDPSIRKSNKPLMEKKRRARINDCLGQLKTLVLQALKKDSSQFSKLEKADILELTVKHLRNMQRQHISAAMATDPSVIGKYRAGFNECANEVMRYIGSSHGVNDDVRTQLIGHLANCLQTVNTVSQVQPGQMQRCLQPLHVQIPSSGNQSVPNVPSMPASLLQTPVSQTSVQTPTSAPSSESPTQFSGAFHLLPTNVCSGNAVAVYVGSPNSSTVTSALPVYSIQVPQNNNGVTAFVPSGPVNSEHSPIHRDLETSFCLDRKYTDSKHVSFTSPMCSPLSVSLKEDKLWRPW